MSELQEQYRLLEVPADVSFATLKQAYKDLVLVWHPDRFSDHPRLQKKAEEKLKCINLAYQEISAVCRHKEQPHDAKAACHQPPQNRTSNARNHNAQTQQSKHYSQEPSNSERDPKGPRDDCKTSRPQTPPYHSHASGISLAQARFVISHFQFRPLRRDSKHCRYFKSGPFQLAINLKENWISLENLCDSINGFHPILLAIPCKASRLFGGEEARELMAFFQQTQQR